MVGVIAKNLTYHNKLFTILSSFCFYRKISTFLFSSIIKGNNMFYFIILNNLRTETSFTHLIKIWTLKIFIIKSKSCLKYIVFLTRTHDIILKINYGRIWNSHLRIKVLGNFKTRFKIESIFLFQSLIILLSIGTLPRACSSCTSTSWAATATPTRRSRSSTSTPNTWPMKIRKL